MSWLFGKKKHQKESPPDSAEEEQSSSQSEGFIFVDKDSSGTVNPGGDASTYPSGSLYPYISTVPPYPDVVQTNLPKENVQGETEHYLNGVPFKLCKQLESLNNDVEIDRLRINEILSFIERIRNQNYEYDFSVEAAVITESDSYRNDE